MHPDVLLVSFLMFIDIVASLIIQAESENNDCFSSIILNEDPNQIFGFSVDNINYKVATIRLEGCGCFRLYQKSGARGKSQLISRRGINEVNLTRVGSIFKEKCPGVKKSNLRNVQLFKSSTYVIKTTVTTTTVIKTTTMMENKSGSKPAITATTISTTANSPSKPTTKNTTSTATTVEIRISLGFDKKYFGIIQRFQRQRSMIYYLQVDDDLLTFSYFQFLYV